MSELQLLLLLLMSMMVRLRIRIMKWVHYSRLKTNAPVLSHHNNIYHHFFFIEWLLYSKKQTLYKLISVMRPLCSSSRKFVCVLLSTGNQSACFPLAWTSLSCFPAPLPQCVSIVTLAKIQTAGRALWRALHRRDERFPPGDCSFQATDKCDF